jgi:hypothetical protein
VKAAATPSMISGIIGAVSNTSTDFKVVLSRCGRAIGPGFLPYSMRPIGES